jgi:peptidoglycan-associated lipoprotein
MAVIYFDYDDSRLRPDQIDRIDRNFRYLRDNPSVKVLIEGHCDERGTTEYNYVLGENRAKGVRDYFIRNGISPARVQILSRGEEDPIDPGHDETAWSKNRRCEFKFFDQ